MDAFSIKIIKGEISLSLNGQKEGEREKERGRSIT